MRSLLFPAVDLLFGYTGKQLDEATGLQNNLHRWYDSGTGQWMSEDPLRFAAGDENLKRYVGNKAISRLDPNGLQEQDGTFVTSADVLRDIVNNHGKHKYWIVIFSNSNLTDGTITQHANSHAWIGFVDTTKAAQSLAAGLHPTLPLDQVIHGVEGPAVITDETQSRFAVAVAYPVDNRRLVSALRRMQIEMGGIVVRGQKPRLYHLADWNCSSLCVNILETNVTNPGDIRGTTLAYSIGNDVDRIVNYTPGSLGAQIEATAGNYPNALVYHGSQINQGTTQGTSP
jgi:RHS repeat-associated protein